MKREKVPPSSFTFVLLLTCCADARDPEEEKNFRRLASEFPEMGKDPVVIGALLNMYCKCKGLETALKIFRSFEIYCGSDVTVWNVLFSCCAEEITLLLRWNFFPGSKKSNLRCDVHFAAHSLCEHVHI
jgi:hypothetical protein